MTKLLTIHQFWLSESGVPPAVLDLSKENQKKANIAGFDYKLWTLKSLYLEISQQDKRRIKAFKNNPAKCDFARFLILEKYDGIYIDMDEWVHWDESHKNGYFISRLQGGKGFIVNGIMRIPRELCSCVLKKARDFIDNRRLGDARSVGIVPLRHCLNQINFEWRVIALPGPELDPPGKVWKQKPNSTAWKDHINLWEPVKTMTNELS